MNASFEAAAARLTADIRALRRRELRFGRNAVQPHFEALWRAIPQDQGMLLVAAQELSLQQRHLAAVNLAESAALRAPLTPQQDFVLAQIYFHARRPAQAMAAFARVRAVLGDDPAVLLPLGIASVAHGDRDAAREAFQRALAVSPQSIPAAHELVLLEKVTADSPVLAMLERLTKDIDRMPAIDQARLHYALGKAYDDLNEPQRAAIAFAAGAVSLRRHAANAMAIEERDSERAHALAQRLFANRRLAKPLAGNHIFVVGMPRTGTTMTEQILLGDAKTASVGETAALAESIGPWVGDLDVASASPADVASLFVSERLAVQAENYRARLRDYDAGAAEVIIDKTPQNYLWAPLASAALGARIVHCQRNALDTCWSLYTTWFGAATVWSYDFAAIARAYGRYVRIMQTIEDCVGDAMCRLQYEDMVHDPKKISAALYKHCRLAWRPEVTDFASSRNAVITPSRAQVRKSVSTSSVNRVSPYLPHIAGLLDALRAEGVAVD